MMILPEVKLCYGSKLVPCPDPRVRTASRRTTSKETEKTVYQLNIRKKYKLSMLLLISSTLTYFLYGTTALEELRPPCNEGFFI